MKLNNNKKSHVNPYNGVNLYTSLQGNGLLCTYTNTWSWNIVPSKWEGKLKLWLLKEGCGGKGQELKHISVT